MSHSKTEIKLNPQQREAVTHQQGPLLIIAGAGTGKTTVITERIKWLIRQKLAQPSEILALTFTEKASLEMENRVDQALPIGYVQTWISTFHSFCEQILRQEIIHLKLSPAFQILSQPETYLLFRNNLHRLPLKHYRPKSNPEKYLPHLLTHFDRLRDENISPQKYLSFTKKLLQKEESQEKKIEAEQYNELAQTFATFQRIKEENNVFDFADLIFYTVRLFSQNPDILKKYQEKFRYILLDEFQDTNTIQNQLTILLAGEKANITAVCDDDQSIYSWRGASLNNVLDFRKNYPQAKIISLLQNYRSPQDILDQSYYFIQQNNPYRLEEQEKINKKLIAVNQKSSGNIQIFWEEKEEEEAETIIKEILSQKEKDPDKKLDDFAILVRANSQALPFIQALSRAGLPYQTLSPGQLYYQPEIKNLIAYLKILHHPMDSISLYQVLANQQTHFIPRKDLALLSAQASQNNQSIYQTLKEIDLCTLPLETKTPQQVKGFLKLFHSHLEKVPDLGPGQLLYLFLKDTGLLKHYENPENINQDKEIKNIAQFFEHIKRFEARNLDNKLADFIDYLDFSIEQGDSPLASETDYFEADAVNILTLHNAKGLEFPIIFLTNIVDGRFPSRFRQEKIPLPEELSSQKLSPKDNHLHEERRLFYVGMTRAKEKLFLTGAKFYYQNKRPKKLSPFIHQTLGENLENYLTAKKKSTQTTLFTEWQETTPPETEIIHAPHIEKISFSQLNTFMTCPRQYKYQYLLRIPTPDSPSLSFGTSIHETLANLLRRYLQEKRKMNLAEIYQILEENWLKKGYSSPEQEKKQKSEARKIIKNFFQKEYPPQHPILKIEHPFNLKIGKIHLTGKIDRTDQLSENKIEIIDYKTGQVKKQKDVDKDLQLSLYTLAATQKNIFNTPPEKIQLTLFFLSEGKKIHTQRNADDLAITKNKVIETIKEIESGNFQPNRGIQCNYCPFQSLCPAYQGNTSY